MDLHLFDAASDNATTHKISSPGSTKKDVSCSSDRTTDRGRAVRTHSLAFLLLRTFLIHHKVISSYKILCRSYLKFSQTRFLPEYPLSHFDCTSNYVRMCASTSTSRLWLSLGSVDLSHESILHEHINAAASRRAVRGHFECSFQMGTLIFNTLQALSLVFRILARLSPSASTPNFLPCTVSTTLGLPNTGVEIATNFHGRRPTARRKWIRGQ
jgi:hypothetical protein